MKILLDYINKYGLNKYIDLDAGQKLRVYFGVHPDLFLKSLGNSYLRVFALKCIHTLKGE
ncbi:MAG: hypothetical protein WCY84_03470 [Candidatus Cloacimonadaceae bacterium]